MRIVERKLLKRQAIFTAVIGHEEVGRIWIYSVQFRGQPAWGLVKVHVQEHVQRQGIGTALYMAAAKFAKSKDAKLVSLQRIEDSASNLLWEKWEREGKATRYPKAGWAGVQDAFVLSGDLE